VRKILTVTIKLGRALGQSGSHADNSKGRNRVAGCYYYSGSALNTIFSLDVIEESHC